MKCSQLTWQRKREIIEWKHQMCFFFDRLQMKIEMETNNEKQNTAAQNIIADIARENELNSKLGKK